MEPNGIAAMLDHGDRQQPDRASAYEDAMSTNNGGSTVRVTMHPSSTTQVLNICFVSTHGFYTHACFSSGERLFIVRPNLCFEHKKVINTCFVVGGDLIAFGP